MRRHLGEILPARLLGAGLIARLPLLRHDLIEDGFVGDEWRGDLQHRND